MKWYMIYQTQPLRGEIESKAEILAPAYQVRISLFDFFESSSSRALYSLLKGMDSRPCNMTGPKRSNCPQGIRTVVLICYIRHFCTAFVGKGWFRCVEMPKTCRKIHGTSLASGTLAYRSPSSTIQVSGQHASWASEVVSLVSLVRLSSFFGLGDPIDDHRSPSGDYGLLPVPLTRCPNRGLCKSHNQMAWKHGQLRRLSTRLRSGWSSAGNGQNG